MTTISVPKEAVSIYNSALEKTNMGDLPTALCEYQRAVKMYPYFIEAYNNMGEIYSLMGNSEMAISIYNKALDIQRNSKVLLNLGVEYYNTGRYQKALDYFLDSLREKPDYLEANYYTGLTYYNLKQYDDAERYLRQVISSDRKHLKANYILSHIYYEAKEYARVIEHLDAIWDIADDRVFMNKYYGFCCFYVGRYNDAVQYLNEAISFHPEYKKLKSYIESLTYENRVKEIGDVDAAIKKLEAVMMNDSFDLKDATRLSMLYVFRGENRKAEELLLDFKKKRFQVAS